jgi:hypothetical protein
MIYEAPESYILKIPVSVGPEVANSKSLQSYKFLLRIPWRWGEIMHLVLLGCI